MTQAARTSGHFRRDMMGVLTRQPMIASTALFMKHVEETTDAPGKVACTDGRMVHVWPAFHRYDQAERYGVLMHEYMHAILQHPLRAMRLKLRYGKEFRHDIMNIGADAIINKGIKTGIARDKTVRLPDDGVCLDKIQAQAQAIVELTGVKVDYKRMGTVGKLSLEWMYDALLRLEQAAKCYRTATDQADDQAEGENGTQGASGQTSADAGNDNKAPTKDEKERLSKEEKLDEFLEGMRSPQDIVLDELERMTLTEIDDGIRAGIDRLRAAQSMSSGHSSACSDLIELLAGDIPVVKTPWESSFRSITQRHLSRVRLRQPTKPGRRVLSQEAMKVQHVVWSPGRRRPPVPRVVVVMDSSGSILPAEYKRYLGEIQAMKRRTNAQLFVIVADAAVHSLQEVDDVKSVAEIAFQGRGGTDFRPAIALACEIEADLIVYLTDLMGTFPERDPGIPVLWTVTTPEIPNGYEPPFGRVLHVD